jgi:peroxiredoxin
LRSFQERLGEFERRGVRLLAISVDPPEVSRELRRDEGYRFTILSDVDATVIRRYDVLHEGAGQGGAAIARPAEFLVDSGGVVRWVNLTESVVVRARPEQVLQALDALDGARAARP